MSISQAHIAGIGISASSSNLDLCSLAILASTKALLDAGITYAKVGLSITCFLDEQQLRIPAACFEAFGRQKAPVCAMSNQSALFMAVQCVRSEQVDCVILVGLDQASERDYQEPLAMVNMASRQLRTGSARKRR